MSEFFMHNNLTGNNEPITLSMSIYKASLSVKCYPASIETKYKYNGLLSGCAKKTIEKEGKDIECSFHLASDGGEWIYYNYK